MWMCVKRWRWPTTNGVKRAGDDEEEDETDEELRKVDMCLSFLHLQIPDIYDDGGDNGV